jgi:hypothetical protein
MPYPKHINSSDAEYITRFENIIEYISHFNRLPPADDPSLFIQKMSYLLRRYKYRQAKRPLPIDLKNTLDELLLKYPKPAAVGFVGTAINEDFTIYAKLAHYLNTQPKPPPQSSKIREIYQLGYTLSRYKCGVDKTSIPPKIKKELDDAIAMTRDNELQKYDNILEYIQVFQREPSISPKNKFIQSLSHVLRSYKSNIKKSLPQELRFRLNIKIKNLEEKTALLNQKKNVDSNNSESISKEGVKIINEYIKNSRQVSRATKEPEIFKYFEIIEDDLQLQQFDKDLEKRKKCYKTKDLEL